MKKLVLFFVLFLVFVPDYFAVDKSDVKYEVYDYLVDVNIDVSGNLNVKEIIGIKGTFNGYIRDLVYKNSSLDEFTGDFNDFKGSSIYNGSNIVINKVGIIDYKGDLSFDTFNQKVTLFNICSNYKGCYLKNNILDGVSLKMFNETKKDITYFYIEYLVGNVVVVHDDVAEVYYNFIGNDFDDEIKSYKLRVTLPFETREETLVWAHGPMDGNVSLIGKYNGNNYFITESNNEKLLELKNENEKIVVDKDEDIIFYGAYLNIDNLKANTPVDLRMVFSKDLLMVDHPYLKKSNVSALDIIISIEKERALEINYKRELARKRIFITYIFTGIYLLGLLIFSFYIYFKHDKEKKSSFKDEYYRDFIDDYDVTVIDYLFNRKISGRAFSTSILNMIYKKNISFEKVSDKDYIFTKVSEEDLSEAEMIIMNIIFDEAGEGNKTSLSHIKNYAKMVKGTTSPFYNKYTIWKNKVTNMSKNENFFEDKSIIKVFGIIYSVLCLKVVFLHALYGIFNFLTFSLIVLTTIFLIYVITFSKRTTKGVEHYTKWKAFKRFLLDFGRFDLKELPDIHLWERYLVYANILGVASKLEKLMKVKFNEFKIDKNNDIIFNYMLWMNLNNTISHSINSSVTLARTSARQAAASARSSGGGYGGGFSSGGGFGGGGGGGRGF